MTWGPLFSLISCSPFHYYFENPGIVNWNEADMSHVSFNVQSPTHTQSLHPVSMELNPMSRSTHAYFSIILHVQKKIIKPHTAIFPNFGLPSVNILVFPKAIKICRPCSYLTVEINIYLTWETITNYIFCEIVKKYLIDTVNCSGINVGVHIDSFPCDRTEACFCIYLL